MDAGVPPGEDAIQAAPPGPNRVVPTGMWEAGQGSVGGGRPSCRAAGSGGVPGEGCNEGM